MKIVKNILKLIVNILTGIIFACLILLIFTRVNIIFSGKEYFEIFGYSFFNVVSGSMEPTINVNDIVIVSNKEEIKEDDIVTYVSKNDFVTHRVLYINGDNVTTKGDANNANDTVIQKSSIIGKVVKIIPQGGVWQKVFTTPSIIISIFVTLIMFDFAFSYKGLKNKKIVKKVDNIDLKEIQKKSPFDNMSDEDIEVIYQKIDQIKHKEDVTFDKNEKEFLDYTIRLDLGQIQKEIDEKIKKEK